MGVTKVDADKTAIALPVPRAQLFKTSDVIS